MVVVVLVHGVFVVLCFDQPYSSQSILSCVAHGVSISPDGGMCMSLCSVCFVLLLFVTVSIVRIEYPAE